MSKLNPTRRNFLAAAAPLAIAPAVAAAATSAKPAAPRPGEYGGPHAPDRLACMCLACMCRDCYERDRARTDGNPLWRATMHALSVGLLALDRLTERGEHCEDWDCELCLCADATRYGIDDLFEAMESDCCHSETYTAHQPDTSLPADAAAYVALHDVLDGLLDFAAAHCQGREDEDECGYCDRADHTVYVVKEAISIFASLGADHGHGAAADLLVARRELLSAERKVARERQRVADGGEFLPHTGRQHIDPERDVEHCREMVAACAVEAKLAERRRAGKRPT